MPNPRPFPLPQPRSPGEPVAVWVSGGVDSGLVLALLLEAGFAPVAVRLRLRPADIDAGDRDAARALASRLGVPFRELDLRETFRRTIVEPFVDGYRRGRTLNPCVECNPLVKLGAAVDWARRELGMARFATGHYARLVDNPYAPGQAPLLARARDLRRDQSYFLYRLPDATRASLLFPLGEAPDKATVRAAAAARGLVREADAPDSQDVCFLPEGDYRDLLPSSGETAAGLTPGPIVDQDGRVTGTHDGLARYTLGQRKGLGAHKGPRYATRLDFDGNTLVIGPREAALSRRVAAERCCWPLRMPVAEGSRRFGKIRSAGALRPCVVVEAGDDRLAVDFDEPVFAPAPGQHLVLYDDADRLVAGGEIVSGENQGGRAG